MVEEFMLVLKGRNNGLENQYFWVNKSLLVGRSRKCDLTLADGVGVDTRDEE